MANAAWVAQLWPFYMKQTKKTTTLINLYTAHDVFIRDIKEAPSSRKHWKKINPHELIWHVAHNDIGWAIDKGALIRQEGRYDTNTMEWHNKTKSLIVPNITTVLFELVGDKNIERLYFVFTCNDEKVSNEVFLIHRKLPWKIKN